MAVAKPKSANVQLLTCPIDEDNTDGSDYRFLLNKQHAKYLTTAPGTFREARKCLNT